MDFVRRAAQTVYHPTSTCAIGSVVDPQLRVYGFEGLRVVDASVMPTITRGNTNAATIMIAEKAADLISDRSPETHQSRGERLMSTTEQAVENLLNEQDWTGKIFSDGWVDAPETIETIEPATGEVLGVAGVANAASVAAATKSAARAQRAWAATPMAERVAIVRRAGEIARAPPRRDHRLDGARVRVRSRRRSTYEIGASIGQLDEAASLISDPARAGADVAGPGPDLDRAPRADRRRRRDHALELPARARDALARPGARARERGRAQERPQHARHAAA